jgi:glycosidase
MKKLSIFKEIIAMKKLSFALCIFFFWSCNNRSDNHLVLNDTSYMSFDFKSPEWVKQTNIYEVNLRQYTKEGTIKAFARELPRLKDMGVKTLWFMPITPISQKNRKGSLGSYYACSDYTSVNAEFGTLQDFKELVDQAHGMGMKVIMDWVANHTGWDHTWTKAHPEYYLIDPKTKDFQIASGMDDIIELDFSKPALVRAMIDAMKFWIKETDIDGFRCDLAFWVELPFWKQARKELEKDKHLFWLGEFDELDNPDYGEVFDASYTWKWMHLTKDFYQNKLSVDTLYSLLKRYDDIGDETMRAWFTTNHDENSWNGTEFEKYGGMAKALAVFTCTWNGIPLIYSGQEIPNVKRLLFFEKDPLYWLEMGNILEGFYKTMFNLRSNNPALRSGDSSVLTYKIKTSDPNVFAYLRKKGSNEVFVVLNLSDKKTGFKITDEKISGIFRDAFSGNGKDLNKERDLFLEQWDYFVLTK